MKCINKQDLFDFINNELSKTEVHIIEDHLSHCEACKNQLKEIEDNIHLLKKSHDDSDFSDIQIPEFKYPETNSPRIIKNNSSLIFKLSIAATIIILISLSVLFLPSKNKEEINLQLIQIEQEMAITELNDAWHERELVITQIDDVTGDVEVFLSSEF